MSEALKPCPFCSGEAEQTSRSNGINYSGWQNAVDHWVFCTTDNCFVHVGMCETSDEAADAWNTRADLPATDEQAVADEKVKALVEASRVFQELRDLIKKQEEYIERLEQTIKNMTAHIRIDPDE